MERIEYNGFFIDRTRIGYRVSKKSNDTIHTHLRNKNPCYKLIDNVVGKKIPKRCGLYYLQSHIRMADDPQYKKRLEEYYNMKSSKGKKQAYFNPHKKKF